MQQNNYDFIIIGGGIFGVYTALWLAKYDLRIALIEKETQLMTKASVVNQARLHSGYHYPRSIATAIMSDDNKERFIYEHRLFVNNKFKKYYAIDEYASFTDTQQFERFCHFLAIHCKRIERHPLFNFQRIAGLYETEEYSFDPILMSQYYRQRIEEYSNIDVFTTHLPTQATIQGKNWYLEIKHIKTTKITQLKAPVVINATYAASNGINKLFGMRDIPLMHEISEIALVTVPKFEDIGLTIMDGQFCSMMPYGKSGLLSLSSVAYTHHKASYESTPHFDCMQRSSTCQPTQLDNCNYCIAQPRSNARKMIAQIRLYMNEDLPISHFKSFYTIKSKLRANYIDDGRPTELFQLHQQPDFYCLFAGKINAMYEVERILKPYVQ